MKRTEPSERGTANVCAQNETESDAAIVVALRPLARLLAPLLREELSRCAAEDWIDQTCSPLGPRRHRELAKRGAFAAHKDGRKWRARRVDVDSYIRAQGTCSPLEAHAANDHAPSEDDDRAVNAVLREHGLESTPKATGARRRSR